MTRGKTPLDVPYLTLAAGLVVAMLVHALNQHWSADFWEHASVVRELARRPWAPRHPLFAVDAPHPFYSPYTLLVGLIARSANLHPITTLAAFGLVNLVALVAAFRLYASAVVGPRAAFYGLVFTLVLWGSDPWRYSGFLHLNMLGFGLAYPSIFALWVTLLALYALVRFLDDGRRRWAILVALSAPVVLLTHPITGIVLGAGLMAHSAGSMRRHPARVLKLGGLVGLVSLAGVLLWPYYPWLSLITTGSATYKQPNLAMYDNVLQRTWPMLLAVPYTVRRWYATPLDRLSCFIAALAALYALGAILQNGLLGRVLPALALGLHLVLADVVAKKEAQLSVASSRRGRRALQWAIAVVVAVGLANMAPGLIRAVPTALLPSSIAQDPRLERPIPVYSPLVGRVGPDDVVMADVNVSRIVPAFAGRVVGFIDPEAFIPDELARREAVHRFFTDITTEERRLLAERYGVAFVAVDQKRMPITASLRDSLNALGQVVFDDGRLFLLKLTRSPGVPSE